MRYVPCWKQIGISKDRYIELLHYCRQYPEWKFEANSMLGVRAVRITGLPSGGGKSDPVAQAVARREKLMSKVELIEDCAVAVGQGEWVMAIIQNVCYGKPYSALNITVLPSSNRNHFFRMRREFFALLDKKKAD